MGEWESGRRINRFGKRCGGLMVTKGEALKGYVESRVRSNEARFVDS